MNIDEKALEAARYAAWIPKGSARIVIEAYLAALPAPTGDVGEMAEALRKKAFRGPTMEAVHLQTVEWKAADALTAQAAKLAECERERDSAREREQATRAANLDVRLHWDVLKSDYDAATARAERLEAALRQYGDHVIRCEARFKDEPCTCGFTAALSGDASQLHRKTAGGRSLQQGLEGNK